MRIGECAGCPDYGVRARYCADDRETQRADCDLTDRCNLLNDLGASVVCGLCCSIAADATDSQRKIAICLFAGRLYLVA